MKVPLLSRSPNSNAACGSCERCLAGQENLCERARFTGCHLDGGYAEFVVADARYCLPIPAPAPAVYSMPLARRLRLLHSTMPMPTMASTPQTIPAHSQMPMV